MNEDYLCHYGVLGMKWGRRKQKPSSGGRKQNRSSGDKKSNKIQNAKAKIKEGLKKIDKNKVKKAAIIGGSALAAVALSQYGPLAFSLVNQARNQAISSGITNKINKVINEGYMLGSNGALSKSFTLSANGLKGSLKTTGQLSGGLADETMKYFEDFVDGIDKVSKKR